MQRRNVLKMVGLATASQLVGDGLLARAAQATEAQFQGRGASGVSPRLNQVGYRTGDVKIATIPSHAPGLNSFRLRDASNNAVAFDGSLGAVLKDDASGDLVRQATFTSLKKPGMYRLDLGGALSAPFTIEDQVYADALRTAVRGYTGQRCGCAVDLGGGYQHPPCHLDGAWGPTTGKSGRLANRGGWHDAGDYGRYVVNSGITCGTLLWAWELYQKPLQNLQLGVPQQHQHLPDYLEEVLWNLEWMLQLQDTDGGVFHKQTSDQFCGFVMPQDDHLVSHVIGTGAAPYKSTAATADLAAVLAIAARCYKPFDKELAGRFLRAARSAWAWAAANPDVAFTNPAGVGTGEYGDHHLGDEYLWASAELWRTTQEAKYEQAFLHALPAGGELSIEAPSWSNVGSLACWTYALASAAGDAQVKARIRQKTRSTAQKLMERSQANGYATTLGLDDYVWGSNGVAGNQSLLLLVDNVFEPSQPSVDAALANLHYMLGRNCFGVSWVTHLGSRPFMHPHHRPSAADGIDAPWPGLLSGGPNRRPGDPVAKTVPPAPPMRMWIDDTGAYSMNEIAINWNAPLVFLLAFANS